MSILTGVRNIAAYLFFKIFLENAFKGVFMAFYGTLIVV